MPFLKLSTAQLFSLLACICAEMAIWFYASVHCTIAFIYFHSLTLSLLDIESLLTSHKQTLNINFKVILLFLLDMFGWLDLL